ncbi:hypothetical protein Dcar01_01892 [Deinococcus carri]|uniref:Uncharacterized protein n=1 Tax=Deinococcus carri TaxID=1211323 RepID=A0ABP9W739_9DEIO
MRTLKLALAVGLLLTVGTVQAGGAGGSGVGGSTGASWCPFGLPRLFPERPAWLGAPAPASAGALRPLRLSVRGGQAGAFVGLLDQFPNGSDAPAGTLGPGQMRSFTLSSRRRTVLFAVAEGGRHDRAFRWPAGQTPAAVTVTLSPAGMRLSVPAFPLACHEGPPS